MEYFIAVNGQQQGPFSIETLRAQRIAPNTLVWAPGMSTWQPAHQVAELQPIFQPQQHQQVNTPQPQAGQQPFQQPSAEIIAKPVNDVTRSLDEGQAYRKWMPTVYSVVGILCCILPLVYIVRVINLDYFKDGMKTVVAILNILIFLAAGAIGLFYWFNRRKAVKTAIDANEKDTLPIVGHFLQSAGESLGLLYYSSMAATTLLSGILIGVSSKRQGGDILVRGIGDAAEYIILGLVVLCLGRLLGDIARSLSKPKESGKNA